MDCRVIGKKSMRTIPENRSLPAGFSKRGSRLDRKSKTDHKELMKMSDEELFAYSRNLRKSMTNILQSIHVENNN